MARPTPKSSRSNPTEPPRPSGDAAAVPAALCLRLKELRHQRNWSLEELARVSGVSRSMLSQIERGRANPTLVVAFRIARAFGLSLADLVEAPEVPSRIVVIRGGDRAYQYRSDRDCAIRTLSPLPLEKDVEFYEVRLNAGGALRSAPHYRGTREFLTVQKGRLRLESGDDTSELSAGDSANYPADVPHALVNLGQGPVWLFLVVIYS